MGKAVDRMALILIVLALVSQLGRPIAQRLAYVNPELWFLPHFDVGLGLVTAILSLALGIGIGVWLLLQARQDHRSPWVWFLFGLVFNLMAVVVYLLLPIYEEKTGRSHSTRGEQAGGDPGVAPGAR